MQTTQDQQTAFFGASYHVAPRPKKKRHETIPYGGKHNKVEVRLLQEEEKLQRRSKTSHQSSAHGEALLREIHHQTNTSFSGKGLRNLKLQQ